MWRHDIKEVDYMFEAFISMSTGNVLGAIGILAAIVSIITELFKKIVPESFPTKA